MQVICSLSLLLGRSTGDIVPVAGTPFDFTQPHTIGERISQVENGYDHNYVRP
jgi:hypothetical protein